MTGWALLGAAHYLSEACALYIIARGKYYSVEQGGNGPVVPFPPYNTPWQSKSRSALFLLTMIVVTEGPQIINAVDH